MTITMSSNSTSTVLQGGSTSGYSDWSLRVDERDAVFAGVGFAVGVLMTLLFICIWRKCKRVKPTEDADNNTEEIL